MQWHRTSRKVNTPPSYFKVFSIDTSNTVNALSILALALTGFLNPPTLFDAWRSRHIRVHETVFSCFHVPCCKLCICAIVENDYTFLGNYHRAFFSFLKLGGTLVSDSSPKNSWSFQNLFLSSYPPICFLLVLLIRIIMLRYFSFLLTSLPCSFLLSFATQQFFISHNVLDTRTDGNSSMSRTRLVVPLGNVRSMRYHNRKQVPVQSSLNTLLRPFVLGPVKPIQNW